MCGTNNGGAILQAILSWWFSFHVLFAFAFGSNEATRSGVNLSLPQPTSRTILSWGGNVRQLRSTRCEYPCRHYCSCQWLQLDRWNDNFDHAITSSLDTDDAWRCMTMQWCSSDNSALSGLIHLRRLWWWMRLLGEVPRRIAPWAQSSALRL